MEPVTVSIQSHTGIAAAVPHLLGFNPTESLVLVGLEGPLDRMAFAMRVDLPASGVEDLLVDELSDRMTGLGFQRVLVVVYTDEPSATGLLPRATLVTMLQDHLEVREALLVRENRTWSYLCVDPGCCPPEGLTYLDTDDATNVASAHALHGRSVLGSRNQLVATVAACEDSAAVTAVLPPLRQAVGTMTPEQRQGALHRLLAVALARLDDPRAELTIEEVAEFVCLLEHYDVRDLFLLQLATTEDPTWRLLVDHAARSAPAGVDDEVCFALALRAYLDGEGVLASAALDRTLATNPRHHLAQLLAAMLDHAVHPDRVRDCFLRLAAESR